MAAKFTILSETFVVNNPIIAHSKILILYGWERQILGKDRWKSRAKTEKLSLFKGNREQSFQFCPGRIEASYLHILKPNYHSFYLKCPRKYQKTYSSNTSPNLHLSPSQNLGNILNLITSSYVYITEIGLCKRLVFLNYVFRKLSNKSLWGVGSTSLGNGRIKSHRLGRVKGVQRDAKVHFKNTRQ